MAMNCFKRRRVLAALRHHPVPLETWRFLMRESAIFAGLSAVERARLRALTTLFLERKAINGARGLVVTPEMAIAVAAQACLPILNLGLDCYAGWIEVVIYPGAFRVVREATDEIGVVSHEDRILSGESWERGPVILSWDDIACDLTSPDPGFNVVVHEFAHKLDMRDGSANGMPPLHRGMAKDRWTMAFSEAFARLQRKQDLHPRRTHHDGIDAYAATDPAEFFAVTSEYFFTDPHTLRREFPAVYEQLALYYRQDPAARRREAQR